MFRVLVLLLLTLIVKSSKDKVPRITLNDGNRIPALGFGTYTLGNQQSFLIAIEVGYRHIDTAYDYDNEKVIGNALKEAFEKNIIKRKDLFITTKVWSTWHSRARAVQCLRIELKDLGLNYSNLALVHWPTGFAEGVYKYPKFDNGTWIPRTWEKDAYLEAYQGLEDAHKLGLARSIGVSNFNIHQLKKVLEISKIKPAVNQIEIHPDFNQERLVQFCKDSNITVTAYSPLSRGNHELWKEPILKEIAQKYNKTVAQVAIRWGVQRGLVVIPKATTKAHQEENINVFDFTLNEDEVKRIFKVKQGKKIIVIPTIQSHPDFPFAEDYNI